MLNRIRLPTYSSEQETPYEIIYHAAKSQDINRITALLDQACIDVQHKTYMPPVARLAEENDQVAVNFLITQFGASLRWAIYGYARGLHFDPLNKILEEAEGTITFLLCEVVYGLVYAGQQEIAKRILDNHPDKLPLLLQYYAYGFGHRGSNADELLIKVPEKYAYTFRLHQCRGYGYSGNLSIGLIALNFWNQLDNTMIREIARAYAMVDNQRALDNLFKKFPQHRLILLPDVVRGYAQAGLHHRINTLFQQNEMTFQDAVPAVCHGLLAGGHLLQVAALREQLPQDYFQLTTLMSYLAPHGHLARIKKILTMQPDLALAAVEGLVLQGNVREALQLKDQNPQAADLYRKEIISALAILGDEHGVNEILLANPFQLAELLEIAVGKFALFGHHAELDQLLQAHPDHHHLWPVAAVHYSHGHHCREAMGLIEDGNRMPVLARQISVAKGFITQKTYDYAYVLWKTKITFAQQSLLAMAEEAALNCNDENDRLVTLAAINQKDFRAHLGKAMEHAALVPRAAKLNDIMRREALPFYLAQHWLNKTLQVLLLQGHLLVEKMQIPVDVYFHILTYYTGLIKQDLNKLGFHMTKLLDEPVAERKKEFNKENCMLTNLLAKKYFRPCWQAKSRVPLRVPLADRSNVVMFR